MPFAANSALCGKGHSAHAPSLFELRFEPLSKVLHRYMYCQEANLLSIVFGSLLEGGHRLETRNGNEHNINKLSYNYQSISRRSM